MASTGFTNLYHRRLVAEKDAKACWICYKPVPTVLITVDNADYFYICPGHLNDSKFATAQDAADMAQQKRDAEIEKEIEAVKKEFAEKMKKKLDRRRQKEYEKDGKKPDEASKPDADDEKQLEKEREEKVEELEKKKRQEPGQAAVDGPRIFALHKNFFQMRQQRKAQAAAAKRNQERMRNPTLFPAVPKDL